MNTYELVVMYESHNNGNIGGTDKRFFEAENDDVAKAVAMGEEIRSIYDVYPGFFLRLTRINNFPIYDQNGCIASQREEHILRRHFPE